MNYTTKPVELPISKDKEYVLVNKYCFTVLSPFANFNYFLCERFNLDKPFKFDNTTGSIGLIGGIEINDGSLELEYFHEVVRSSTSCLDSSRLELDKKVDLAYDLFLVRHDLERNNQTYELFIRNEQTVHGFLAIVEKTNYGKGK